MKKYIYVMCFMLTSLHYLNYASAAESALSNLPQNYCNESESMHFFIHSFVGNDNECILAALPRVKHFKSECVKSPEVCAKKRKGIYANIRGVVTELYSTSTNFPDTDNQYETDDKKYKITIKAKVVRDSCEGEGCGQELQGVLYFESEGKLEEHKIKFTN